METVISDDSPLAEFLGRGGGGGSPTASPPRSRPHSFAPRGPSALQARIRSRLPKPLLPSSLSRADNQRFLEHFRYLVVASQLLGEQAGLRASAIPSFVSLQGRPPTFKGVTTSVTGAGLTAATAFVLVWLVHWARGRPSGFSKGRFVVVVTAFAAVAVTCHAYMRRQWIQYLRQQAVDRCSALITNLQAFETSTSSALALIQEVELVSRGYRLSSPLPPISRLEEKGQARRCLRLRRVLRAAYAVAIPVFQEQCAALNALIEDDDLEKYLDVYEISNPDLQEAAQGYSESEFEDAESLKALRTLQYRLSTLRRVYLCSLLALEADGGNTDRSRWSETVDTMLRLAAPATVWSEKINRILAEEEQFVLPSPAKSNATPGRERLRTSVRKLGTLSQGIRGLQAKMQILREESNKSLEETEDIAELGAHLMAQYDSIGTDLKSLLNAWETGKNSLALNIDRHERRISQASSGLRSPVTSIAALHAVDEGNPSDALRLLNGEPLSPRASAPSSVECGSNSDDEIFEAIAIPKSRTRLSLTREERMQKIQEDRDRQVILRAQREASNNMLKELESVIHLRPQRRGGPGGRVTSL